MRARFILPLVFALSTASTLYSHTGAEGVVKERMDGMKAMGKMSKKVAKMFKGEIEFQPEALIDAADTFILHGRNMVDLFPDNDKSRKGKHTEALPRVWKEWDEFNISAEEFIRISEALVTTIESTSDQKTLKKEFAKAAKSCSSCHKRFRKDKKR